MAPDKSESNQSLARGLRLIEFLSDYPNGCPLARIAELTGINKSTTHRILKSLTGLGYVTAAPSPGSYRLTAKFIAVGYKTYSALNIIHIAAPRMEQLNLETGETVNLSTREGNNGILIYKLEPTTGGLRTRGFVGQRLQLYSTGMGKVFLAYSAEGYLDRYWESPDIEIKRLTDATIVDREAMRKELAAIRMERFAYDHEENEPGICCLAAPIFGVHNRVDYAVSVAIPSALADETKRIRVKAELLRTAETISRAIGGLAEEG